MNKDLIRILLVADVPEDARPIRELLHEIDSARFELAQVEQLEAGLNHPPEEPYHVALLDVGLRESSGLDTLCTLQARDPNLPIIVLTGLDHEAFAAQAVRAGAQDVLVKGRCDARALVSAIHNAIGRQQLLSELRQRSDKSWAGAAQYGHIIEQNADAIVIVDQAGRLRFLNPAAEALFGLRAGAMLGEQIALPLLAGERSETEIVRPDGQVGIAEMRVEATEWNGEFAYLGSLRDITERKRAEEEVRRLKEFSEGILQTMAEGIAVQDADGYITFINPAAEALLGYGADELEGQHWTAIVPADQHATVEAADERRRRGESDRYELRLMRKDGGLVDVLVAGSSRFDGDQFVGTLAVFTDLTEQRRAEAERRSLARFPAENPNPVLRVAQDGTLAYANKSALPLLSDWGCQIGDPLPDGLRRRALEALRSGQSSKFEVPCAGLTYSLIFAPVVGAGYVNLYGRDISDRVQAEEHLRLQALALESAANGIVITDRSGAITWANPAFTFMSGFTAAEVRGQNPSLLKSGQHDREFYKQLWDTILAGEVWRGEITNRRKDGRLFTVQQTITPVRDEQGEIRQFIAIDQDITERKQAEAALRESEERLRILVEGVQDYALFMLDSGGCVVSWNPGAQTIKGYRAEEIIGHHFSVFFPQAAVDSGKPRRLLQQARARGRAADEGWRVRRDGSTFWANVVITALHDELGNLRGFANVTRDRTDHKQAEQRIQQQAEDLALLNAVNAAINRGESLQDIIGLVAVETRRIFSGVSTSVFLLDQDKRELVVPIISMPSALVNQISKLLGTDRPTLRIPLDAGSFYTDLLDAGKPELINDPERIRQLVADVAATANVGGGLPLARLRKLLPRIHEIQGTKSIMFAPLVAEGERIGLLDISGREPFTEADLRRLESIAGHLTAAIKRKQAEQALRITRFSVDRAADAAFWMDSEGCFLDVNEAACDSLGYSRAELLAMSVHDIDPQLPASKWPDHWEQVKRRGSFTFASQHRKKDGQLVPVEISVNHLEYDGREYNCAFARDITERVRAEEALLRREAILEALSFAAGHFLQAPSWEADVQEVLARLGRATQASRVYVFENHVDKAGELIASQRYAWLAPETSPRSEPPDLQRYPWQTGGFARWAAALEQGQPIYGPVSDFPTGEQKLLAAQRIRSLTVVPVFVNQEWWGLIRFDECRRERIWTRAEVEALAAAADTFGAAIRRRRIEEALRASEERLQVVIEHMPVMMEARDEHGNIIVWNRECERVTGYHPDEIVNHPHVSELLLPDPAYRKRLTAELAASGNDYRDREWDWQCKDGTFRTIAWSNISGRVPIPGWARWGIGVDITERKRAEEQIRQRNRELALLNRVIAAAASTLEPEAVLETTCGELARALQVPWASAALLDAERQTLRPVAEYVPAAPFSVMGTAIPVAGNAALEHVLQHKTPLIAADAQSDPRIAPFGESTRPPGIFSAAILPLVVRGQVLGTIALASLERREFTDEEVTLATNAVAAAAQMLENARLLEQLQARNLELNRLYRASDTLFSATTPDAQALAHTIVETVLREFGQSNCSLLLVDASSGQLERLAAAGPYSDDVRRGQLTIDGPGLVPAAIRSGKIRNVPDVRSDPDYVANWEATRSELTIPLRIGDKVIGAIDVQSTEPAAFSADDERLMSTFAERAALALENARLFNETQRRAQEAETLREAGAAVAAALEQDMAIELILEQVARVVPYDSASVQLLGDGYLEVVGGRGWPDSADVLGMRFPIPGDNPNTTVIQERQALVLDHVDFRNVPRGDHVRAWLGVPLMFKDQIIGMLALDSVRPQHFTQEHVRLASAFADQVAVAMQNARLFNETRRRAEEFAAVARVSSAVRTALTRAEMLPVILEQVLNLLEADGAALAMHDPVHEENAVELARGEWQHWSGERLPAGEGISGQVIAEGEPYISNDGHDDRPFARPEPGGELSAVACIPLIAQEQTIGALWVGRQVPITDEEVHLLTAIGDIAASAIQRATLHEQTQRRMQRLAGLRQIDMAITASVDVRVTFNVVLDQVTTQLGVDATDILLLNPHTQTLEYASGRGFQTAALHHTKLRLGDGFAGRAALKRQIVNVPDLTRDAGGLVRSPAFPGEGFASYFAVPLVAKGQVKGVLEVFHRAPLSPDQEWIDFLETLAGQAAIAIDNAALFDDLQRSNVELTLAYDTTLEGWSRALDLRDQETEGHTQRVTSLTLRLARALGMSEPELVHVRRGALLHDIGKMGIPDSILLKPGPLAEDEWQIMRRHPTYAYELLAPIAYLRPALDIPYCHHEKWDGTGYPRGLKTEQIPLAARVFAVADVWDALRSDRPYRKAWPEKKVREYIRVQAGKHFDPLVVQTFLTAEGDNG